MSARKGQGSTLGIAIAVAAVLAALVVLAVTQVRLPKSTAVKPPKVEPSSVAIARPNGGNAELRAQVELYDPKPLFLPTPINSSDPALPATLRREPGSAFKAIPPKPLFIEYEKLNIELPYPVAMPENPAEVWRTGETANPFFSFGRINYPYTPLPKRLAFLEVLQAKTGRTVIAVPLSTDPKNSLPAVDWQPLEMAVAVEPTGLVGEPMVTGLGSGFDEVDDYFRAFIVKQFRLGARLPPGFYMLRIGP